MQLFRFGRLSMISIHAPAKGATNLRHRCTVHGGISIHAPAKGATFFCCYFCWFGGFQSTLPRRERRQQCGKRFPAENISIHAPAKGATVIFPVPCFEPVGISIHAPAKGATMLLCTIAAYIIISIHAPAKGATLTRFTLRCTIRISIHAPAKGATFNPLDGKGIRNEFQSTLPRRERRASLRNSGENS